MSGLLCIETAVSGPNQALVSDGAKFIVWFPGRCIMISRAVDFWASAAVTGPPFNSASMMPPWRGGVTLSRAASLHRSHPPDDNRGVTYGWRYGWPAVTIRELQRT